MAYGKFEDSGVLDSCSAERSEWYDIDAEQPLQMSGGIWGKVLIK